MREQRSIEKALRFESLVQDILSRHFRVQALAKPENLSDLFGPRFDFIILGPQIAVEVKYTSSSAASNSLIQRAISQLSDAMKSGAAQSGIVIVSSSVGLGDLLGVRSNELRVWGLEELLFLCGEDLGLRDRLEGFIKEALPFFNRQTLRERRVPTNFKEIRPSVEFVEVTDSFRPRPVRNFCRELRDLKCGDRNWRKFELISSGAIKYCLDDHLARWSEQKRTDTGRSVYDMVAAISSVHDFWQMIRRDFRTAYTVFEFKNYCKPISQTQIYTTEKYLYANALRSVAFLLCREGASNNALAAAKGALREHGKLIVCFTLNDLCEMVKLKDRGDEPTSVLMDIVDELLIKLER